MKKEDETIGYVIATIIKYIFALLGWLFLLYMGGIIIVNIIERDGLADLTLPHLATIVAIVVGLVYLYKKINKICD